MLLGLSAKVCWVPVLASALEYSLLSGSTAAWQQIKLAQQPRPDHVIMPPPAAYTSGQHPMRHATACPQVCQNARLHLS